MKKRYAALLFGLTLLIPFLALTALPAAAEPEGSITVTVNTEPENVCFGIGYPLPAPAAYDEAGTDLTDMIRVTVQRPDGDWTDVSGFSSVPWQPGMTFPITEHVEYHVIYAVPEGGETAQAVKVLNVMDTLQSVSVSPSEIRIPVGSSFPADTLTVTAQYSQSGNVPLSPDGYTLNTDNVNYSAAGEYTASVSVTSPYGGTKTAEIRVITEEDEPDDPIVDQSSLSIRVNAEGMNADIPFGGEYTAPGVTVTATDASGNPVDLSQNVLVSVYLIDGENRHPVAGHENQPDSPAARSIPITVHGTYAVVYTVTNGELSESTEYTLTVHDTLMSVSVLPGSYRFPVGSELSFTGLTVKAVYSLSGEITLPTDGYTLNTESVMKETAGDYTATVSVTSPYGGTKTAAVSVTVYEDVPGVDLSSVSIAVSAAGNSADIPFGGSYTIPGVTVTATDANGDPIDLSANAVFSVFRENGTEWVPLDGLSGSAADEAARRIPITEHGTYKIVYSVANGSRTAEAEYLLNVQDTLLSISAAPYEYKVLTGKAPSFDGLTVTALYSRSGETALSAGNYTLDTSAVNTDQPGEYTATVSFTDTFGGTKTASLKVTVYSDDPEVDLSSLNLKVNAAANQANAAYGYVFALPDVTVTATDKKGNPLDLSGAVTLTVYHADTAGWQQVSGFINVKNTVAARSLPINLHGTYRIVYSVENGTLRSDAEYVLNVQDTLVGVTAQASGATVFHPGDRIDAGLLNVTGEFSNTGKRRLNASEFTFSPAAAPQKTGNFTVTVTVTRTYEGVTVKKTATVTMTVVPVEQKIDKSRVDLTADSGKEKLSFGELCQLPDVTATAFDADGNEKDIHDTVTWTLQYTDGEKGSEWTDVEGFIDLPITQAITDGKPLCFLPEKHGYYRVIYSAEAYEKQGTASFGFTVMDTLLSIKADTSEMPLDYELGEDLDLRLLVVNREFSYSGTSAIPYGEYRIDRGNFDRNTAGTYTVTVSYSYEYGGTKTDSFTVTVTDPFSGFTVSKFPAKRVYAIGEPLDLSDLEAKAVLPEEGEVFIKSTALEIKGFDPNTAGTQTVEILFHGVSGGTFEVTVNDALFSIEIDASEVVKEIGPDGIPDYSGLKVTWIGVSGQRRLLTPDEYTVSPDSFKGYKTGSYPVTVTCIDNVTGAKHTATFRVSVTGKAASKLPLYIGGAVLLVGIIAAVAVFRRKER